MCCDSGWQAVPENPWHGDCDRVELSCGESADEGGKVGPTHREVAGAYLTEALVKPSLNESTKGPAERERSGN